jgi:hypothetical protein
VTIATALILDRQEPSRPPQPTRSTPVSLTSADVARIARRVERIRHLRFVRPVKPLFVGRAEAIRLEQEGSQEEYPQSRQRADEEALKLIGLMRPEDSLAKATDAIAREQVLGFYDNRRKRLVVVRDRRANRPLLEITLAHELVHALEDQRFGLRENADPNDDTALAETALAEGTATEVMAEYAVRNFGIRDALGLFEAAGSTDTKLPAYVEDTLLFPYEQGLEFVETLRGASRSWKAVDNVLRLRRPSTEEQVLHTVKYAVDERAAAVGMPDLGLVLGGGWQRLGASSVGELDLRELFKIVGRRRDDAAAAGWGGGRFELWRRDPGGSCPSPCVTKDVGAMKLAWDTASDGRVAERALGRAFVKGLDARTVGGRAGVRLWTSRGGAIAMRGSGSSTAIVFAPDSRTAARVLAALV